MRECYICGSRENLHRHHIDWHHNHNVPSNIVILCQRCHALIHGGTGYMSLEELTEIRAKVRSYKNDPFAPQLGSTRVLECIHCGEKFPETEAKWNKELEIWMCRNHPQCSGAGVGFDLWPTEQD